MKNRKIDIEPKCNNIFIMKTGWYALMTLKEEMQIEHFAFSYSQSFF